MISYRFGSRRKNGCVKYAGSRLGGRESSEPLRKVGGRQGIRFLVEMAWPSSPSWYFFRARPTKVFAASLCI